MGIIWYFELLAFALNTKGTSQRWTYFADCLNMLQVKPFHSNIQSFPFISRVLGSSWHSSAREMSSRSWAWSLTDSTRSSSTDQSQVSLIFESLIPGFILNPLVRSEQGHEGPHLALKGREPDHGPGEQQDLRHGDGMLLSALTIYNDLSNY